MKDLVLLIAMLYLYCTKKSHTSFASSKTTSIHSQSVTVICSYKCTYTVYNYYWMLNSMVTGWLYDGTGSYDISFYVAGTMVAISGAMLYFLPLVQKCLGRRPPKDEIELSIPDQEMQDIAWWSDHHFSSWWNESWYQLFNERCTASR